MIFIVIGLLVLVVEEVAIVFGVVGGFVLVEEVASVFRLVGCSLVHMVVMTSSHQISVRKL